MKVELPEQADWFKWRLLTSQDLHVSLREFETHWSWLDAWEAHRVLDAIEAARAEARRRAEQEARKR